jgi:glycosyltransferase involved in cell wall biosynthesis
MGASAPSAPSQIGLTGHYLGRLHDDLSRALAYSAADAFVAPSMEENLANTVIEAMACGTPCVAFEIGGMPDIIKHHQNGYLAKPFDTGDLARGIIWIMEDKEHYLQLSAQSRKIVEREFSEEIQAQRFSALYEDIIGKRV